MKAKIEDGNIQFVTVPKIYKNIIGFYKLSDEELKIYGFYNVIIPNYNVLYQTLGIPYYDNINEVVTYLVEDLILNLEEVRSRKLNELKDLVKDLYVSIQGFIIEKQIHNEVISEVVKDKIKSIRTKYNQVRDNINTFTTVEEIVEFVLPYSQIEEIKNQLEAIE